jgi:hypothetical protein
MMPGVVFSPRPLGQDIDRAILEARRHHLRQLSNLVALEDELDLAIQLEAKAILIDRELSRNPDAPSAHYPDLLEPDVRELLR